MSRHVSLSATVLLVEDSQDDRQMYAEYLRVCGFRTIEVDNTSDGLALAPTADVIVTGIRVRGPFDGVELVRRLRQDPRMRGKLILVLTASVFEPDPRRAHAAGCDVFLAKPCLPDTLVSEIRGALKARGVRRRSIARGRRRDRRRDVA